MLNTILHARRRHLSAISALVIAFGLQGWFSAASAELGSANSKEIVIGCVNVISGPTKLYGEQTDVGVKALINSVNDAGGINGYSLRLVIDDDRYEPDGAEAAFQRMLDKDVFCLTGLIGSVCLGKYLPRSEHYKLPAVGFYPGPLFAYVPVKRYAFPGRTPYRDEMRRTVEHLWKDLGIRKIGMIYQNDPFGADCLEGVKGALEKHGAEVVGYGSYTRNRNDMGDAFQQVKKSMPDAVIFGGVAAAAAQFVHLVQQSGWRPIIVLNSGSGIDLFLKQAGPQETEGIIFSEVVPPPSRTDLPLVAKYRKALQTYFPNETPNFISLRGYLDALLVVEGLKRAGKQPTRESFVQALEGMHKVNIGLGRGYDLTFSPEDHLGFRDVFFGVIRNGKIESITDWKRASLLKR